MNTSGGRAQEFTTNQASHATCGPPYDINIHLTHWTCCLLLQLTALTICSGVSQLQPYMRCIVHLYTVKYTFMKLFKHRIHLCSPSSLICFNSVKIGWRKSKPRGISLHLSPFSLRLPTGVSPEAFVPALKVLIALINADELRCKTFVDVLLPLRRETEKKDNWLSRGL